MQAFTDSTYRHVQGLSRGLRILRALNEAECGEATPRDLGLKTQINRTTVKRILETLAAEGYVRVCATEGRYAVGRAVVQLGRGMTEEARVLIYTAPVMKQLGDETGWSLRITTPLNDRMVIRDSTHPHSNLSGEAWGGLRHALPILLTAAGRAFFAYSDAETRHHIVERIQAQRDEQTPIANNGRLVEQLTRRVLDDGYALNDGAWGERRLGAVAVPIRRRDGRPVASMSMLYARSDVSRAVIEQDIVPALRHSVKSMEAQM